MAGVCIGPTIALPLLWRLLRRRRTGDVALPALAIESMNTIATPIPAAPSVSAALALSCNNSQEIRPVPAEDSGHRNNHGHSMLDGTAHKLKRAIDLNSQRPPLGRSCMLRLAALSRQSNGFFEQTCYNSRLRVRISPPARNCLAIITCPIFS